MGLVKQKVYTFFFIIESFIFTSFVLFSRHIFLNKFQNHYMLFIFNILYTFISKLIRQLVTQHILYIASYLCIKVSKFYPTNLLSYLLFYVSLIYYPVSNF